MKMRRAPAVAHAFAIAHAMLRLLATPKTTPVFPAKTCAVINAVTIRRINSPQSFGGTRAVVSHYLAPIARTPFITSEGYSALHGMANLPLCSPNRHGQDC